ncbi:uncharacterized protein LOC118195518 isoform X1 [Stegodyphus dumicola]|uniref:uncharacterized protein LOC118195518 isoform X1 n=1 Tax=Stegodyphus dumicola TaxID=202533 RepID=UPI0015B1ED80|nr:uncharacterized protein LOC118195518 isoform X1 [Stegodyphus dumicola]
MDSNLILILTLLILAETSFSFPSPMIPQRSLREIVNKRRQLNYIKTLLQDLDDKLEKLEKRSCPINLPGMDCDYGEVSGTGKDAIVWSSSLGPGKKRRYRRALQYLL